MSTSILERDLLGSDDAYFVAIALAVAPALSMAFGSAAVRMGMPSDVVQARFQNLSAGLLIGALLAEIYPMLRERLIGADGNKQVEVANCLSALGGFVLALGIMYGLHSLEHSATPDEEVEKALQRAATGDLEDAPPMVQRVATAQMAKLNSGSVQLNLAVSALSKMQKGQGDIDVEKLDEQLHFVDFALDSMRRSCHGIELLTGPATQETRSRIAELLEDVEALQAVSPRKVITMDGQIQRASATLRRLHVHTSPMAFRRWGVHRTVTQAALQADFGPDRSSSQSRLPWGLVFAIAIDAAVDGMLIGLSTSTSAGAGMMMAIATFIEMGFLGYSFGCAVSSQVQNRLVALSLLAIPPLCLAGCGIGAFALGSALQSCFVFTGLISFSLVAVLFLVIQELILEAAEKNEGENWNVSIFIYLGLLISFGLEVVL